MLTFKNIATNPVSLIFILHNANTGVSQIYGDLTHFEGAADLEANGVTIGSTNSLEAVELTKGLDFQNGEWRPE